MSLVELIVSMLIFTVVIAATAQLAIGFERSSVETINRQDQIDDARFSVEAMSTTLRTAVMPNQLTTTCTQCLQDAFVEGSDYVVQFYANYKNPGNSVGPSRVTYRLSRTGADAGALTELIQRPNSNVPSTTGYVYCDAEAINAPESCRSKLTKRVVGRDVLDTTGAPIFTYFDGNGNLLDPGTGSLDANELSRVVVIELRVTTQSGEGAKAQPTTYIQRITLPNAQAVLRQDSSESES